ncbi:MAG: chemotaxis protein CheD [Myxococcota bacterium]
MTHIPLHKHTSTQGDVDAPKHIVKMGDGHVAAAPWRIETVLGSCLGIALVWRRQAIYGMAHVVLPRCTNPDDPRKTRYGDTAVPYLLETMGVPRSQWKDVRAVLAGGSQIFQEGKTHVGASNDESVRASLRSHRIRVIGEDTGGTTPRRLVINTSTGIVECIHLVKDDEPSSSRWKLMH